MTDASGSLCDPSRGRGKTKAGAFGDTGNMNALWVFSEAVELVASIAFLLMGVSGSLYAYGFSAGRVTPKRFGWRPDFKSTLRWLAPLLAFLSLGALVFQIHDLRTSYLTPNPAAPLNGGHPRLFAFLAHWPAANEPQCCAGARYVAVAGMGYNDIR
jgi:hypothetical protein